MSETIDARPLLIEVTAALRDIVVDVTTDQLDWPGLGEWSVRDLLGHTLRAVVTARQYYDGGPVGAPPTMANPGEYFRTATLSDPDIQQSIAQRGRDSGAALGDDVLASFDRTLAESRAVIDRAELDAVIAVAGGSMTYREYLHTRLFELVVHTDDLCRALDVPNPLSAEVLHAVVLMAVDVATTDQLVTLLRATTGRAGIAEGFTVLG